MKRIVRVLLLLPFLLAVGCIGTLCQVVNTRSPATRTPALIFTHTPSLAPVRATGTPTVRAWLRRHWRILTAPRVTRLALGCQKPGSDCPAGGRPAVEMRRGWIRLSSY